jgi:CHAT domain-containing protein
MAGRHPHDWYRLAWAGVGWRQAEALAQDNPKRSAEILTRVTAIVEELLGRDHLYTANCYSRIIWIHILRGDHAAALPVGRKLARSYVGTPREGSIEHLTAMSHLALIHQQMGDVRASLPLSREVTRLALEKYGVKSWLYHMTLNNLGLAARRAGEIHEAFACIAMARELRLRYLPAGHPLQAYGASNLADLYKMFGDYRLALPLEKEALEIRRAAFGRRHIDYAATLNNYSCTLRELGRYEEARRGFLEVLDILREVIGELQPKYAFTLHNLARAHAFQGRPSAALPLIERCLELTRRNINLLSTVTSDRQLLGLASSNSDMVDLRLSLPDNDASASHAHVLEVKGYAFLRQWERRTFARLASSPGEARELAAELPTLCRQLASLPGTPRARAESERLTRRKEEVEQRLAELSADFREVRRRPTSAAVAEALQEEAALIDFFYYSKADRFVPSVWRMWERRLAAWVVRKGHPVRRVELGPAEPIEEALARWREAIEKGRDEGESPARLRKLLWEPVAKHLGGVEVALIAPDAELARLPFAALPGSKAGRYLIEEMAIATAPVPRMIARPLPPAPPGEPSLLAAGAPSFGEGKWEDLPAAVPEMESLSSRFKAAFRKEPRRLSGAEVTKDALTAQLPRHRFAHLATHGFFLPHASRKGDDEVDGSAAGWHPGLLSGLVLARANDPKVTDAFLTALEVAELDLSRMELAVLSACETGLGKEAGTEGLLGLQRAFAVAGCQSVVSSLWSVDDAATSILMERFYHHLWEKKLSRIKALQQAQLDLLRNPALRNARQAELEKAAGPRGAARLRGIGRAVPAEGGERSPTAWWAAWQLSGAWR